MALSLLLTGAVSPPGGTGEPVRTRAQALVERTVRPPATLPLAGHPASTPVRLIGASEEGVAIWQGAPAGSGAAPTVYTGALTSRDGTLRLTARPGAGVGTRPDSLIRLSVAGPVLAWYELGGEKAAYPQEKRIDLAGGRDVTADRARSLAVRERPQGGAATTPYTQIEPGGLPTAAPRGRWLRFAEVSARFTTYRGRWVLEHEQAGSRVVHRVTLPAGVTADSGLDAVGDRLYTVSGGARPAVYVVQGRSVTKVADVPAARYPVSSFALSAGSIHYTDQSVRRSAVFGAPVVTGGGTISLGPSTALGQRAGGSPSMVPIAFSAGRGVLAAPGVPRQWQLLDGGRTTAVIAQRPVEVGGQERFVDDRSPAVSGAYTLVGGQVFRPDGELLWSEPGAAAVAGQDALYGSEVVYSVPAGGQDADGNDLAGVWSVNAERALPIRLDTRACERAPEVAVWAGTAAWANCDASRVTVQNLRTGEQREVDTGLGLIVGSPASPITGLTLREGVLAWRDGEALTLLDLSDPDSAPVVLPGATGAFSLDGSLVARRVRTTAGAGRVVVDRLPFAVDLRPRMVSAAAPLGFTPNGDGEFDKWQPQFDVTRPVRGARLRVLAPSGRVVRTFRVAGDLRGVSWDGRSGSGRRLPVGQYEWELTATAVDGSGTLTSAESDTRPRGTIEISSVVHARAGAR
ncbi:hypothetical protein KIH74_09980 [Kineosporia sp. J2-2]|uniref:FlgD Ig-like domain-containing protein n=1 Tax=Kineosporia corallincola TaxID=2835133 RepID=A0ABS5TDU3_9ACTN|nr:hypothetical protein [Kineosporia corallincola]MBT0769249.1 hypothetical protein [Kineosporia corallincola]